MPRFIRDLLVTYMVICALLFGAFQCFAQLTTTGAGGSGVSASVATVWSGTNIGTGIARSNGNLTATYTGSSSTNAVWASVSHSTGKFYFELTWTTSVNNARESGIGNGSAGTTGYQVGVTDANSIGWGGGGPVFYNGSTIANVSNYGSGPPYTIAEAVDLGGALIWFMDNASGTWNSNALANPATGIGGISLSVASGPYFPMVSLFSSGDSVTGCFLPGCYAYTPPVGFGNW